MNRPESVRRPEVKAAASNRRTVLVVCLAIAAAAIGYALFREAQDPRFAAQIGSVSGLAHETSADVVAAAQIDPAQNAWLIDRRAAERRIEALPWVARAKMNISWPNVVDIDVTERKPVARVELVAAAAAAPAAFAVIDQLGRVLAVTTDPSERADLPTISVAPPPGGGTEPGQQLARADVTQALDALHELRSLGLVVSAVSVAPSTGIGATADRNLRVLFGDDDDLARKAALFLAIAAKISTPERIAYVDVRSVRAPTVLYR